MCTSFFKIFYITELSRISLEILAIEMSQPNTKFWLRDKFPLWVRSEMFLAWFSCSYKTKHFVGENNDQSGKKTMTNLVRGHWLVSFVSFHDDLESKWAIRKPHFKLSVEKYTAQSNFFFEN